MIPLNNPNLPNYRFPIWAHLIRRLERSLDWCDDLSRIDLKKKYLVQLPGEFEEDFEARLKVEDPEPFFADAVKDHASIFQQFELDEDAPKMLIEKQNNVDGTGLDLWQWAGHTLIPLFRDGGALLGADMPPASTVEEMKRDRTPRLFWVPLRDLYWIEYRQYGGIEKLSRVAIKRQIDAIDKGSVKSRWEYWVYELDEQSQCFLSVWQEVDDQLSVIEDARPILGANGKPLNRLPFTDKFNFLGTLNFDDERQLIGPFNALLSLNIEHYNLKSKLTTMLGKVAVPTALRFWENGVPDRLPPFYAGSGKTQDYSAGCRVEYLELKGQSIPEMRSHLEKIESKIAARDNKLFHIEGAIKSATEASIENQKSKTGYPGLKRLIESAYQDLFVVYELFANSGFNPETDEICSITISDEVLRQPPAADEVRATMESYSVGIASAQTALNRLVRIGFYDKEDLEVNDDELSDERSLYVGEAVIPGPEAGQAGDDTGNLDEESGD